MAQIKLQYISYSLYCFVTLESVMIQTAILCAIATVKSECCQSPKLGR